MVWPETSPNAGLYYVIDSTVSIGMSHLVMNILYNVQLYLLTLRYILK